MYHNQLNAKLVTVIKQHIPKNDHLVPVLSKMLSLGKEAIYRRIRGDVPFTFEEVVKISLKFGISLDKIVGTSNVLNKNRWALLDIDTLFSSADDYLGQYCRRLELYRDMFLEMQNSGKAVLRFASHMMPNSIMMSYEKLSLFRHYKWNYLTQGVDPSFVFSKMKLPAEVKQLEAQLVSECHKVPRALIVLDRNIFSSLINDIKYFFQRNLIDEKELQELRCELLDVISFMEKLMASGFHEGGSETTFYLLDIGLDSSYIHLEYEENEFCAHTAYFIDIMDFNNPKVCQKQKDWIELLKRYSIQITQSGEVERFKFFNEQRILINNLL